MRAAFASLLLLLVFATGASAHSGALHLVRVAHFNSPVYATPAPGEPGSLYVVEQAGVIRVLTGGRIRSTPFLDIRSQVLSGGEQGLLSVAFDPAYQKSHRFFIDYTDKRGDTHVVEYRSNGTRAIPSSAKQRLFVKDFAPNHNGGQLQFGPDGRLYWGNGDGGGGGDPQHNGQSLARPFAKIMRLNINAAKPRWALVAYGLRNPWRFAFDRENGDLYIADVGQNRLEEVNAVRGAGRGLNYGWDIMEGGDCFEPSQGCDQDGLTLPVTDYDHGDGCSISGGYVYRGQAIPDLQGTYFYSDYCSGFVRSFRFDGSGATDERSWPELEPPSGDRQVTSFGEDADGELYLMTDGGSVYKVVPR
jgi:glucose/arabinose dehydrogenase